MDVVARDATKDIETPPYYSKFTDKDVAFAKLMFHRRHVYEHNGGEADEKYIADSGDSAVQPKQALRETKETTERCLKLIAKLGENLHEGFHKIFPKVPHP